MNLKIKDYKSLEEFMKETRLKYCKTCKKVTYHRKCGFGNVNSFVGNARLECLGCENE